MLAATPDSRLQDFNTGTSAMVAIDTDDSYTTYGAAVDGT
jgi:hypothetical protein